MKWIYDRKEKLVTVAASIAIGLILGYVVFGQGSASDTRYNGGEAVTQHGIKIALRGMGYVVSDEERLYTAHLLVYNMSGAPFDLGAVDFSFSDTKNNKHDLPDDWKRTLCGLLAVSPIMEPGKLIDGWIFCKLTDDSIIESVMVAGSIHGVWDMSNEQDVDVIPNPFM